MKPLIVVTPGDPDGIGPEVVWKTIQAEPPLLRKIRLLCIGAREPFERLGARVIEIDPTKKEFPNPSSDPYVWLLAAPTSLPKKGHAKLLPGYQAGWSIATATELVKNGIGDALVTGPIHKERLQQGGYLFTGHTEFLASLCHTKKVTMMLANDRLKVSLVTIHSALSDVPHLISAEAIRRCVLQTAHALKDWWKIPEPRIAVAALNPHAGEGGLFGKEEIKVIQPTLRSLRRSLGSRVELIGPLPADTLFAQHFAKDSYDAVVCMYHDQGLIPVKMIDFQNTVNLTLGLPIIRTSVDHGTAFDIAGKNVADPSSFQAALSLAARFALR